MRRCNQYCEHFCDISFEYFCKYKKKLNVAYGADCLYGLPEVSEKQRIEVDSKLEEMIQFQKITRKNPKKIMGSHNLRIVT